MRERHGTPFEHNSMRFHIKCRSSLREWQRHRIGSFNRVVGRYSQLEPEFYGARAETCEPRWASRARTPRAAGRGGGRRRARGAAPVYEQAYAAYQGR